MDKETRRMLFYALLAEVLLLGLCFGLRRAVASPPTDSGTPVGKTGSDLTCSVYGYFLNPDGSTKPWFNNSGNLTSGTIYTVSYAKGQPQSALPQLLELGQNCGTGGATIGTGHFHTGQ